MYDFVHKQGEPMRIRQGLVATLLAAAALASCNNTPTCTIAVPKARGETTCESKARDYLVCTSFTEHVIPLKEHDLVLRIKHGMLSYKGEAAHTTLWQEFHPLGYAFSGTYSQTPGMTTVVPIPLEEQFAVVKQLGRMGFNGPYEY